MTSGMHSLINLVSFNVGWFTSVLGAANGLPFLGPLVVAGLVALDAFLNGAGKQRFLFFALIGAFGFAVDTSLGIAGVHRFTDAGWPVWLTPVWLLGMWFNLATTVEGCLSWLNGRYVLAALFAAVGGPASYYAGREFGAIEFGVSTPVAIIALALCWAAAMPLLFIIRNWSVEGCPFPAHEPTR